MNNEAQRGDLVLADMSGYTSYLTGVELTHAGDILTGLLNLIVEHLKPFLSIVRLEGDAAREMIRAGLSPGTAMPQHINGFTRSSAEE